VVSSRLGVGAEWLALMPGSLTRSPNVQALSAVFPKTSIAWISWLFPPVFWSAGGEQLREVKQHCSIPYDFEAPFLDGVHEVHDATHQCQDHLGGGHDGDLGWDGLQSEAPGNTVISTLPSVRFSISTAQSAIILA
jgi:hypothetical protein